MLLFCRSWPTDDSNGPQGGVCLLLQGQELTTLVGQLILPVQANSWFKLPPPCAFRRRTLKFSSGAGGRDFISRKAVLPAPSAATAGSAVVVAANVCYLFNPPRVLLIAPQ